ncbi:ras-related protein Rab-23 [Procambarus clarkii]|uniref:ras-related protein Rab-23 n=1 Tax=Procambarus clarkii TaxID=6728 RepID=UPI001E671927|nr:ras-related protein Rab-23-like [Procambarus clarkii]
MTIMREEDLEVAIKVVIVGNGAVGKSSMIQRYCKGTFTKDYKKTIGVDFLERQLSLSGEEVRLMLWDTAGQEEFDAITKAYYRGAQACVVAFSTTDRDSFTAVRKWKKKVEDECGSIPMVLVQNKIDLIDQATVKPDEVESLARELRVRLYRTSVKEDLNVDQVFNFLVERYMALINTSDETHTPKSVGENIFGNPGKLKKGDTITLGGKKKSSKKQLIKSACKVI